MEPTSEFSVSNNNGQNTFDIFHQKKSKGNKFRKNEGYSQNVLSDLLIYTSQIFVLTAKSMYIY